MSKTSRRDFIKTTTAATAGVAVTGINALRAERVPVSYTHLTLPTSDLV